MTSSSTDYMTSYVDQLRAINWSAVLSSEGVIARACPIVGELATRALRVFQQGTAQRDPAVVLRGMAQLTQAMTAGADYWNSVDRLPQPVRVAAIAECMLRYDQGGIRLTTSTRGQQIRGAEFALHFVLRERVRLKRAVEQYHWTTHPQYLAQHAGISALFERMMHDYALAVPERLLDACAQGNIDPQIMDEVRSRPSEVMPLYRALLQERAFGSAAHVGRIYHAHAAEGDTSNVLSHLAIVLLNIESYLNWAPSHIMERATTRATTQALMYIEQLMPEQVGLMESATRAGRPLYWGHYIDFASVQELWRRLCARDDVEGGALLQEVAGLMTVFASPGDEMMTGIE